MPDNEQEKLSLIERCLRWIVFLTVFAVSYLYYDSVELIVFYYFNLIAMVWHVAIVIMDASEGKEYTTKDSLFECFENHPYVARAYIGFLCAMTLHVIIT